MTQKIYDNSNLAESYAGTTTPLTFSFATKMYEGVYQHFCLMMGVSEKIIIANKKTMFPHMVEFIGFRMYYDLLNWYKLVSLLPGYKWNHEFLEQMLGVQKTHNFKKELKNGFVSKYLIDLPVLLFQVGKITFAFIFMGRSIRKFNQHFDKKYEEINKIELDELSPDKLRSLYHKLVHEFIGRFRVPIANDLAVMISSGMADKYYQKHIGKNGIYPFLRLSSHKSLTSLDPGFEIQSLAKKITKDTGVSSLFKKNNSSEKIWELLKKDFNTHPLTTAIQNYLKKYGGRAPDELKLESESLKESPEKLIAILKNSLQPSTTNPSTSTPSKQDIEVPKGIIAKWLLHWTQNSIRRREETRFRRALIFGYARKIFISIGKIFEKEGIIHDKRDIFYATTDEIWEVIDSKIAATEIQEIIEHKKEMMNKWENIESPRRIETTKNIEALEFEILSSKKEKKISNKKSTFALNGMVASFSEKEIKGTTLVLSEFDPNADFNGKILVTSQTDPGWTIVFPLLKGLIVERGGMLSHAAIVARELNIPCIVGVESATEIIPNDSLVKMDLTNGIIDHEK